MLKKGNTSNNTEGGKAMSNDEHRYSYDTVMLRQGKTELHIGAQIGVEPCECAAKLPWGGLPSCDDCQGRGDVDVYGYTVMHDGDCAGREDLAFEEAASLFARLAGEPRWTVADVEKRADEYSRASDEAGAAERAAGWDATP